MSQSIEEQAPKGEEIQQGDQTQSQEAPTTPRMSVEHAVELFNSERYLESNDTLLDLIKRGFESSFLSFCIGRNLLYCNDLAGARAWFDRAIQQEPVFAWSRYERGRLLDLEGDPVAASQEIKAFVDRHVGESVSSFLNQAHVETIVAIAHRCFAKDRAAAVALYRSLALIGVRDYLSALRIVEEQIDLGRLAEAELAIHQLQAAHTLDAWGHFARARLQFAQQEPALAVATVLAVAAANPDNNRLKVFVGHRLLEFRAFTEAADYYERELQPLIGKSRDADKDIDSIRFRLSVVTRDHERILADLRTPGFLARMPNWLSVEALFKFTPPAEQMDQSDIQVATELADFLAAEWPYTLGTALSLYQFYSRGRRWESVQALEDRLRDEPMFGHPELVLRRFETLCSMSRMQEARVFHAEHYRGRNLRQWEACVVLRFLAEARMWDEAADLLRIFLKSGYHFPSGEYFLLKICRRTGLHDDIITIVDSTPAAEAPAQFPILRQLVADDQVLRHGANAGTVELEAVLPPGRIARHNRVLVKSAQAVHGGRVAGFLCADKAYFFSVLTFLASYAAHGTGDEAIVWYVFLDKEVPAAWYDILDSFAGKIGIELTLIDEQDIVDADAIHVEAYGMFTGGSTLSRAAFLRIYGARYIYATGRFERAFYVDTDIICQHDLATFISQPFEQALLMARAEEPSLEMRDVGRRHGLQDMQYFNSGVLIFNLESETILDNLSEAIRLSEQEPTRLMYHDQCALNLAFMDKVRYLAPEYNYFLRPNRLDNGDWSHATFVHFLEKPKPWDVSFQREYRALWVRYAEVVRIMLTSEAYTAIVAAAND